MKRNGGDPSRRRFLQGAAAAGLVGWPPGQTPGGSLLIRGGTIVTAEGQRRADIRIEGEKIVEVGPGLEPRGAGETVLDASGRHVLPGGIDPHVHLQSPWVDDYTTGSRAALAGGITTVGNMTPVRRGETPLAAIERTRLRVERESIVDVVLHPILGDPSREALDDFPRMIEAGHSSVKVFMVGRGFERRAAEYSNALREAGRAGLLTLIHCEDGAMIGEATRRLLDEGKRGVAFYGQSRPIAAEEAATRRAVAMCESTGAPIYVVHLSSRAALDACREGQRRGLPVSVETRPLYLHLTDDRYAEPDGAKYTGQPPLRTAGDLEALWAGVLDGAVHTVGTDHAPWRLEQKLQDRLDISNFRAGVANLQLMLPMLWSEGVGRRGLTPERFVQVTSTNAARLLGLYPTKGAIRAGSDADLAIWDIGETRRVERGALHSRAGYSVFEGTEVTGWPVTTIRRGEIVFRGGEIVGAPGSGRLPRRSRTQPL